MEMLKKFEPLALLFVILGALNWGILGLTDTNVSPRSSAPARSPT